nr:unnamed protein product [Callosobruchus chinensis]
MDWYHRRSHRWEGRFGYNRSHHNIGTRGSRRFHKPFHDARHQHPVPETDQSASKLLLVRRPVRLRGVAISGDRLDRGVLAAVRVGRISPGEWENPYPCIKEPEYLVNQLDLRNCFWFVTGSIMQQGSEIELKSPPTRMVAGMWWFFTLLMVSSYTANLAAFLTTENPDPHFSNFHELVTNAETKKIKYGAKRGGATPNFFRDKAKQDENSDFAKAWKFMESHLDEVMVGENKLGVEKARSEQYAFFMESTSIEYEVQRKCDLNQVGEKLDEKGYGIAMRKNSHYRNTLSTAILQMQNSGKIEAIKRKWWQERKGGGQCSGDQESGEATHLELKGVEGVFWVTIGGGFLAFFLAIVETILYAAKKSHRTKIPFADCLKEEVQFYFKFGTMEKQVIPESTTESSGRSMDEEEKADMTYNGFMQHQPVSIDTLLSTNSNQTAPAAQSNKRSKSKSQPATAYFNRDNI